MEKYQKILLVFAAIVLLILIIYIMYRHSRKKGRKAENKVAKVLKKSGKKQGCRLINNAYLPLYNGTCEVDHILVGPFGVLSVETKGISGKISGSGKNLIHTIGSKNYSLYNPRLQNQTHIDNISYHLKKHGYRNIPVLGVVVFSAEDITLLTNVGIYLKDLPDYVASLRNVGCPTDEIADYLNSIRVKNPLKKFMHRIKTSMKK